MNVFVATLTRDLLLVWRNRSDALVSLSFFVIVACLFPFGVGADPKQLHLLGAGIVWVAALLASLLALPRLFSQDYENGTLEQLLLSSTSPLVWIGAKIVAHWLATGLPLVLIAPLLALMYGLTMGEISILIYGLLLGTPLLSLIGAIGAALTLGLRGSGTLLALLILPLFVPVLVFGAGAVEAYASGMVGDAHLLLLAAGSLIAVVFAPLACSAALRVAVE